jgi:hypothetical protein
LNLLCYSGIENQSLFASKTKRGKVLHRQVWGEPWKCHIEHWFYQRASASALQQPGITDEVEAKVIDWIIHAYTFLVVEVVLHNCISEF